MSVEGDLHAALMAQVEGLTGYTVIWPQKGADKPAGEHLSVFHLPNDNRRTFFGNAEPLERKGFIVIHLVSQLGKYEVVSKRKAGEIAEAIAIGTEMTVNGQTVTIHSHSIKAGGEVDGRWETPIWLEYRGYA